MATLSALTPYAYGGYDSFDIYYGGNVASLTSELGAGVNEFEFFEFNISSLSQDPNSYSGSYGFVETLFYTPSTSDPFDTHTINIEYSFLSASDAASLASGTAGSDASTYYNEAEPLTSVGVKASFGPASPAVNNNVTQSVNIASLLQRAAANSDEVLVIWASETSGGVSNVDSPFFIAPECFALGTRIALADGEAAVETLCAGDLVRTSRDGVSATRPVIWVGSRRVDLTVHPDPDLIAPIRVRRGAIAENMPHRDLLVSPDHALHVHGALVAARRLVNGTSIVAEIGLDTVTYFHVELDTHCLLLAEGLTAESYLPGDGASFFARPDAPVALHPGLAARPTARTEAMALLSDDVAVEAIHRRVADRARALGFSSARTTVMTHDAAACLEIAGKTILAVQATSTRAVFVLPTGTNSARLVSRAARPTATRPWADDRRRLGVRVGRITLHDADGARALALDHPDLGAGWWEMERSAAELWRWTDGGALLPGLAGVLIVAIDFAALDGGYPLANAPDASHWRALSTAA